MTASPMKPLIPSLKVSSFFIGHLFDMEKLKSSDGRAFEGGRWRASKTLLLIGLTFALFPAFPVVNKVEKIG